MHFGRRTRVALRHCEERSNPDKKLYVWIASSFLLAMTRSVSKKSIIFAAKTVSHEG